MTVTKNRFLVESFKGTIQDLSKTCYVYKDAGVCVCGCRQDDVRLSFTQNLMRPDFLPLYENVARIYQIRVLPSCIC